MASGAPSASAEVSINASPDAIYALITDLPTLAELAAETTSAQWHKGDAAKRGAVFKGTNQNGSHKWTTTCTVTEATPGQVFAFDVHSLVIPVAHWRYEIIPTDDGSQVTESTWDRRPGWFKKIAGYATGVHDRVSTNGENIRATLERLKARAEG